ncbi:MAG TPA: hypothetical protein VFH45_04370, partial [Acidimicrobiales bacterium]|nr:hypothetical protein [Acidimicrobiales bacterium]
ALGRDGSTRRSGPRTARRWELPEHLGLRLALGGTLGIAAALLTGWPMAGAWMGALGYASPVLASVGRRRAAEVARVEAIAAWAEMLRDQVAVGADLAQAIQASAGRAPAPLVEALSRLAWRMRRADPTSALAAFGEELADPMADLVVAALVVAFTRPARRVGDLLGALSESAREQAAMRLRIERDRARVRTVARASTAAAIAWVVILYAVSGRFFAPYDTPGGQVVLTLVGLAFAGGFWGLSRLDRIAPATRLQVAGARQEAAR